MATAIARVEEHRTPGERLVAKVRELIRQGNVRRIIIKNEEGRALICRRFHGATVLPGRPHVRARDPQGIR